jgi:hypothetical protein
MADEIETSPNDVIAPTVLATYAKPKVWLRIALMIVICSTVPAITGALFYYHPPAGSPNVFIPTMVVLLWILLIPATRSLLSIFSEVVFHKARLIWIEKDKLIWRDPSFFSLACAEITHMSCGTGGNFSQLDTITFRMRTGEEKVIATDALAEDCDEVVKKIRRYLGL